MRVKFGPWTPDQPDLDSGGLEECVNCLPLASGYGALRDAVTLSGSAAVPGLVCGSQIVEDPGVGAYMFVGQRSPVRLGRMFLAIQSGTGTSATFANVSRTASYSSTVAGWSMVQFGSTVLAANGADAMQVGSTSSNFRDQSASASAPVARYLAPVRDFVFAGNLSGARNRVQWCQINNPLRWTPSPRAQSDFQDLPDTGNIVGMTGGDFAAIFTERAIWRATYVGSPIIFRFDQVAPNVSVLAPASIARYQNLSFFLGKTGFQVFDGQQVLPIGDGGVDKFALNFVEDWDTNNSNLRGIVDRYNKLYIMSVRSTASGFKLLIYNFVSQNWAIVEKPVTWLTESLALAAGKIDAAWIPSVPASQTLRDRLGIGLFNASDAAYQEFYSANRLTATFATGESQLFPDRRGFVKGIRPLIQGNSSTTITAEVGKRDRLNQTVTYTSPVTANSNGVVPVRADARYHRVRVNVSGGFERAIGFDIEATPSGRR